MIKQLKYLHIYIPVIFTVWIGLAFDGISFAQVNPNAQWSTNLLVISVFTWVYAKTSKQVKQLMLLGLLLATAGEIIFSIVLGMYTYRLENLPLYIPFGHSIIYAAVFYIVKEPIIKNNKQVIINVLYFTMIIYSTLWLFFGSDALGFLCTLVIALIYKRRPNIKLFFLVMYFMIAYLELIGTHYGCWHWPDVWFDKLTFVQSANPPSGISVFYFGFDAGCFWLYKKFYPHKWQRFISIQRVKR